MKLMIPGMSEPLSFRDNKIYSIVIESPKFLFDVLQDINNQMQKMDGKVVLSIKDVPTDLSKHAEMITDFICFDVNKKTLITKVVAMLDSIAQDDEHHLTTHRLTGEVESYVYDLAMNTDCSIAFDNLTFSQLLKACNIRLNISEGSLGEKVIDYMSLVRELIGDKLFILVNFRAFVGEDEAQLFLNTVANHDYKVLLFESTDRQRLNGETRITIDNDLCEF